MKEIASLAKLDHIPLYDELVRFPKEGELFWRNLFSDRKNQNVWSIIIKY
jgi:hypothetical protein